MAEKDVPEQIAIMREMLELAKEQAELARVRTRMSADRSRMSEDRSRMSADRSRMSEDRSRMSEDRSRMSEDRSRMSADRSRMSLDRSEMSETRSYHNAERTLSVWVRTALSLMVLGIALDRFGLLLHRIPGGKAYGALHGNELLNGLSTWTGAGLVLLGIFMAAATGLRFAAYARTWRRRHRLPPRHGPFLATFFALMTAIFGVLLLVLMLLFSD